MVLNNHTELKFEPILMIMIESICIAMNKTPISTVRELYVEKVSTFGQAESLQKVCLSHHCPISLILSLWMLQVSESIGK